MRTTSVMHAARQRLRVYALALAAAVLAALGLGAANARADLGSAASVLSSFDVSSTSTQAGAHPDFSVGFHFIVDPNTLNPFVNARTTTIKLPPGVLGDPNAVPHCSRSDFLSFACPPASAVGEAFVTLGGQPDNDTSIPVFNLPPAAGEAARLGFTPIQPVEVSIKARSESDFGLTNDPTPLPGLFPQSGAISAVRLVLWGVPHDPVHSVVSGFTAPPEDPLAPFMSNPTRCDSGSLTTSLAVTTWEDPDRVLDATATSPAPTDCGAVPFDPSLHVSPSADGTGTTVAQDSPTPLRVDVDLPVNEDSTGRATAHMRNAVVTLPQGISLSPSAAVGLEACTDDELKLGSNDQPACPAASVIGTSEVDSPVLTGLLRGNIYLAQQTAAEPYRIFVVANGSGITLKLIGHVHPDPTTGQLTTTFTDLPEVPVRRFTLAFRGGAAAPLATGLTCGPATSTSVLTPWSGTAGQSPSSMFSIAGCPTALPWTPGFTAGSSTTRSGSTGDLSVVVDRADGQATLNRIDVALPAGISARIADVPLCSAADGAAGTCPESSRIGDATIAAGAGGSPIVLHADGLQPGGGNHGGVYLTTRFRGAPYGLSIVVDTKGQAGPFDLGRVVVPATVDVDPQTAALTIKSDPLPTILQGIPLRIRRVGIDVDRAGFITTPTSCDEKTINGTLGSVEAGDAHASARFQASDCARLPFSPRMTARLSGAAPRFGAHLALDATLTQAAGQASVRNLAFTLPRGVVADGPALRVTCTNTQLAANRCPTLSRRGTASAVSPLLPGPLTGPVWLVRQPRGLPDLVLQLHGPIDIELHGHITLAGDRLRTTFQPPDVALKSFHLHLFGGKHGLVTASETLCKPSQLDAQENAVAYNGKRADRTVRISAQRCTPPKKHKKK